MRSFYNSGYAYYLSLQTMPDRLMAGRQSLILNMKVRPLLRQHNKKISINLMVQDQFSIMATTKLSGKDLKAIGYPEGRAIGAAMKVMESHYKGKSKSFKLDLLEKVIKNPTFYKEDDRLRPIAHGLLVQTEHNKTIPLKSKRTEYAIYGSEGIEAGAINQMEIAMKLPVTKSGALMPDAHQGYGLPIGGVLATENAVIPYGVGVDIGCRMAMTIYDIPASIITDRKDDLRQMLLDNTKFGRASFKRPIDHEVIENKLFNEIQVIKALKDRAWQQLGSSGGGNHFVEFGITDIMDPDNEFGLNPGSYLAVLSHSGSRGLGANIARFYTKLARDLCKLPDEARHLAYLNLDTEAGQEYWLAMNLAGDYASACHAQIHDRMSSSLKARPVARIENHHNFAWKEKDADGNEIIVHRKGATPAGKGVLGIIPGSMTAPGFIVRGKGNHDSINSASHGAGRQMSRTQAKKVLNQREVVQFLKDAQVDVIGSGLDEAPHAYKDIHKVMKAQSSLVDVVGKFTPKIIRMCGDEKFSDVDGK